MVQTDGLKDFAVFIVGPTASGKTALAAELAKRFKSVVISADSVAIYRGLDIGSAKPSDEEKAIAPHKLIDIVDPREEFSVAEYEAAGLKEINSLFSQNKVPVICGGTGFYVDSLLYVKSYGNCPKNNEIRAKLDVVLKENGAAYLHSLLEKVDEKSAKILHENDTFRVSRALEIYYSTGKKKSEITDEKIPRFKYFAFSFDYPRAVLYSRINERVEKMFEKGLLDEVKGLLHSGVKKNAQSMRAIGYKEVVEGLERGENEQEIKEKIKLNSRRFAKRQITYFKRMENLVYLKNFDTLAAADEASEYIKNELERN